MLSRFPYRQPQAPVSPLPVRHFVVDKPHHSSNERRTGNPAAAGQPEALSPSRTRSPPSPSHSNRVHLNRRLNTTTPISFTRQTTSRAQLLYGPSPPPPRYLSNLSTNKLQSRFPTRKQKPSAPPSPSTPRPEAHPHPTRQPSSPQPSTLFPHNPSSPRTQTPSPPSATSKSPSLTPRAPGQRSSPRQTVTRPVSATCSWSRIVGAASRLPVY